MTNKFYTITKNGAVQFGTTGNLNLDVFSKIASWRSVAITNKDFIIGEWNRAFIENPAMAVSILFWIRSVRNGSGERKIFEVILNHLMKYYPKFVIDNMEYIAENGSFKDLAKIYSKYKYATKEIRTKVVEVFHKAIVVDKNQLAMKWLPRTSELYSRVKNMSKMTNKEFRKLVNSHTVETNICAKNYNEINYTHVPSLAMNRYKNLFSKNDNERFMEVINNKDSKIHSNVLYPYQLVSDVLCRAGWCAMNANKISEEDKAILDKQWKSMDVGSGIDAIVVVDTSGSMTTSTGIKTKNRLVTCMDVSISLGMYCAERVKGAWANKIISFSMTPEIIDVKQYDNFAENVVNIRNRAEGFNTDLRKVFQLILKNAIDKNIPNEEMPKKLIMISDMQFDSGVISGEHNAECTLHQEMEKMFKYHGYDLPQIVYWNVSKYNTGHPLSENEFGMMMSGFSQNQFKQICKGNIITPMDAMLETISEFTKKLNCSSLPNEFDSFTKDIASNSMEDKTKHRVELNNTPAWARLS